MSFDNSKTFVLILVKFASTEDLYNFLYRRRSVIFHETLTADQNPIQFQYKNLVSDQKTQLTSHELHFTVSHQVML
jgi:hypothetical protein